MKKEWLICLALVVLAVLGAGCGKKDIYGEENRNIQADGIQLGQVEEDLPAYLTAGIKENCVYGYELRSSDPEVTVGVSGDRGTLRKIITAVPEHIIYEVSPGQELSLAEKTLLNAGFDKEGTGHKYILNGIRVELLSMENKVVDRISIEIIE